MPTMGALRWVPPMEPWKAALPKANTPPSDPEAHNPWLALGGKTSCSVSGSITVLLLFKPVMAKPVEKHPGPMQATRFGEPKAVTLGEGSTDHADPFQLSIIGLGEAFWFWPLATPCAPDAQHWEGPRQVT